MTIPSSGSSASVFGIGLVLISTVGLAAQNVLLRVFFSPQTVLGRFDIGGFVEPDFSNILLLLALRMIVMALCLAGLSGWLYSQTLAEMKTLVRSPRLLGLTLGSGVCLFLGQVLLYTALSQVAAGIAIATFFIYPAITVLLSWRIFCRRPPTYQLAIMGVILVGVSLVNVTADLSTAGSPVLGVLTALGAALGFGTYGIVAESCLQPPSDQARLHPIPFSLITFSITALLSVATVLLVHSGIQPVSIASVHALAILWMTLASALLTLAAYVLNNFGIRYIGAALTALISATVPVLTTLLAWMVLRESLGIIQLLGVCIVTLGVGTLSLKSSRSP